MIFFSRKFFAIKSVYALVSIVFVFFFLIVFFIVLHYQGIYPNYIDNERGNMYYYDIFSRSASK